MTFDSRDPGTSVTTWAQDARRGLLRRLSLEAVTGFLVLAAHPDDETLGAGGLIGSARARGLPVTVVIVTDGAAGGKAPDPPHPGLAEIRADEAAKAMMALAVADVRFLGFADGSIREERENIARSVHTLLAEFPDRLLVAPWTGDGHRDHRVLGEIASTAASQTGTQIWSYPIWLWHWASPGDARVPWRVFAALDLDPPAQSAKAAAIDCYVSQTRGTPPLLHARFLNHFEGSDEVYVVTDTHASTTSARSAQGMAVT